MQNFHQVFLLGHNFFDVFVGGRRLIQIFSRPYSVNNVLALQNLNFLLQVKLLLGLGPAQNSSRAMRATLETFSIAHPSDDIASAALAPGNDAFFQAKGGRRALPVDEHLLTEMRLFGRIVVGDIDHGLKFGDPVQFLVNHVLNCFHHKLPVGQRKFNAVPHLVEVGLSLFMPQKKVVELLRRIDTHRVFAV